MERGGHLSLLLSHLPPDTSNQSAYKTNSSTQANSLCCSKEVSETASGTVNPAGESGQPSVHVAGPWN